MTYIFGKKKYDGQEYEYIRICSETPIQDYEMGKFMSVSICQPSLISTHTFKIYRKFDFRKINDKYYYYYYITDHMIDNNRVADLQQKIQDQAVRLIWQGEQISKQDSQIDDIVIDLLKG